MVLLFSLAFGQFAMGATYYIDYQSGSDSNPGTSPTAPWKLAPGMTGFSGKYTHQPGDVFLFKGGVTWPASVLPLNILYSGRPDAHDQYRADMSWYAGRAWSYPVFDGGGSKMGIYALDKDYFIIDSLKIVNNGNGVLSGDNGMAFVRCSNYAIRNCHIQPNTISAIANGMSPLRDTENVEISGNLIMDALKLLTFGGNQYRSTNNIRIFNNRFSGSTQGNIGQYHTNGIHIFGYTPTTKIPHEKGYSFNNVYIYNNVFDGNWRYGATAYIYFGEGVNNAWIFNNVLSFDNTTSDAKSYMFSPGAIYILTSDNIRIYNNTISSAGLYAYNSGIKTGIALQNASRIDIRNNLMAYVENGIIITETCRDYFSDSNFFFIRPSGGRVGIAGSIWARTLAEWQKAGFDINSKEGDPKFMNDTAPPMDLRLKSESPALASGENLSQIFSTDILSRSRPFRGKWTIGAYEGTGIYPPSGLRVIP